MAGRQYTAEHMMRLVAPVLCHTHLIEIETPHNWLRYNTSHWHIDIDGVVYQGGGDAISVEFPDEDKTLAAHPLKLMLAGVSSAMVSFAMSTPMSNRRIRVYHAILDEEYRVIRPLPLVFAGRISHIDLVNTSEEQ